MERPAGHFFLGETIDDDGKRTGDKVHLDSADLTTHGVIVGMTGSGKTGLGVVLLEEALISGIPVLAIDPKGDIGNLALTFPDLKADDFEPWMDAGTARVKKKSLGEMAEATAGLWSSGLKSWDMGSNDITQLKESAETVIYTPGSTVGVGLDILGRLSAPATADPGARQDEVDSVISGLLSLVNVDSDPLSGREHILLSNLVSRAWESGTEINLAELLGQLLDPPFRKLGVLELDTFFPPKDRQALAMKLNGLLASPSFATWTKGAPLDIPSMLWSPEGKARASVLAINHLTETERQFVITLVLSKLISWMRTQPGTGELRVLVYIDEVMGLAPPIGNPPTKKPILTLLKQARAFGIGLVLSTQNPVDLDYKAISNAGTWMIGRLQTEQDKKRLIDGLRAADGTTDVNDITTRISGLDKRQFVKRSTRSSDLPILTSRWAMSYLAGPLTGDQINRLMVDTKAELEGAPSTDTATAPAQQATTPAAASGASRVADLGDDESLVPPSIPDQVPVRYVVRAAPWLDEVDATANGTRLSPALAARVNLLFDERAAKLRHNEEWETIIPLTGPEIDVDQGTTVDFDDRDFTTDAPDGAVYVLPGMEITASAIRSATSALKSHLHQDQVLKLLINPELKLWSRPDEAAEAFRARCEAAADDGADADAEKIRTKLENKRDSVEVALSKAEDRLEELEAQERGNRQRQIVDIGTSILGGLLGGRSKARKLATAARRVSSSSSRSSNSGARIDSAKNRVAEKIDALEDLENDLADALIEIDDEWSAKAEAIEEREVPLEKTDITVEDMMLVWLPTR